MSTTTTNRCATVLAAVWLATGVASRAAWSAKAPATSSLPESPDTGEKILPPILQRAIDDREQEVVAARREAIRLIEDYLRDSPRSREQAEALYKLAELYWEESKAVYLERMGSYQAAVTACHDDHMQCPHVPRRPPTVDLSRAQSVYQRLITEHPRFRKIDTVIYLYGFSLRDQGKTAESVKSFQIILDRFPRSRYVADAWMAIA
jgi:tetratricopeptide (TPR) repeat protein